MYIKNAKRHEDFSSCLFFSIQTGDQFVPVCPEGQHHWNFGDGNTSTDVSPVHTYASDGAFTIMHTLTTLCGRVYTYSEVVDVDSDCFSVLECPCQGQNAINIAAGNGLYIMNTVIPSLTTPTIFSPNSYFNIGNCIAIKGRLIIDQNFELAIFGGEIIMQEGAEIVVEGGSELKLLDITESMGIHACDGMWKGVTAESGASLVVSRSEVRDAQYAVNAKNNSTLNIVNNDFINNHVGIYTSSSSGIQVINQPFPIEQNRFTTAGGLMPPYFQQSPAPGAIGFAGVEVNTGLLFLGFPGQPGTANFFSNLQNGIVAYNSLIGSYYSNMQGIKAQNPIDPLFGPSYQSPDGIGFFSKGSWHFAFDNTITDAIAGMVAIGSYIYAEDNIISTRWDGIDARQPGSIVKILNNTVTFDVRGIRVSAPTSAIKPEIVDNTLHAGNLNYQPLYFGHAISLNLLPGGNVFNSFTQVENNTMNLNAVSSGISLYECGKVGLQGNTANFDNTAAAHAFAPSGIKLSNSDFNKLYDNRINGFSTDWGNGITFDNSSDNTLCCNLVQELRHGLAFFGTCDNSKIKNTDMSDHQRALNCNPGTVTGPQPFGNNRWNGSVIPNPPFNTAAAYHLGSLFDRRGSRFDISTCNQPQWPPSINPSQPCNNNVDQWFRLVEGNEFACGPQDDDCQPIFPFTDDDDDENSITQNDEWAARDKFSGGLYGGSLQWGMKRSLFNKMAGDHTTGHF